MANMNILKDIAEAVKQTSKSTTTPYDTQATVTRIEGNTAWVHIPGGVTETPVRKTIDAKAGDVVQVRVSGGTATLTGNQSAPPTDDTKANKAQETAEKAAGTATDYVLDNANGVFVHPKNNVNDGVLIRDTVQIIRGGKSVAEYGDTVRVGETGSAHIEIGNKILNFIDRFGDTKVQIGLSADGESIYETNYFEIETAGSSLNIDLSAENNLIGVTGVGLTHEGTYTDIETYTYSNGTLTITATLDVGDELEVTLQYQAESSYISVGGDIGTAGDNVLSVGTGNTLSGDNAGAIGTYLQAKEGQFACGKYNKPGTYVFAVGNGTGDSGQSDERRNAFAVGDEGKLYSYDKALFTTGAFKKSVTIAAYQSGTVTIDISKTGYTPVALMGYNTGNDSLNPYYVRINGNSFSMTLANQTLDPITATAYCYIMYVATSAL